MIKVTIGNNMSRHSITIDENETLRTALEKENINYSIGMTSLDGCTLQPGDLDKTFADFGITSACFLINVVKADNAAKLMVSGNALVIESDHTVDDLRKVDAAKPNTLKIIKGTGDRAEEVFSVCVSSRGLGSVNGFGASFSPVPSASGKAMISIAIPSEVLGDTDRVKNWVADTVGGAINQIKKIDSAITPALEKIAEERKTIISEIQGF